MSTVAPPVETPAVPPVTPETPKAPPVETPKPETPVTPAAVVPEKYELKPSEGTPFTAEIVDTIAANARELGLSQEQAQKYLETREKLHIEGLEQHHGAVAAEQAKWLSDLKADPNLGGEKFTQTVTERANLLAKYEQMTGDKELVKVLTDTKFLDHPLFNRLLNWFAVATREDKPPQGGTPPGEKAVDRNDPIARAERMFGKK